MGTLTERQEREIAYHRDHAAKYAHMREAPAIVAAATSERRRWWNPYWHLYTRVRQSDIRDKRMLVIGCGFGDDAITLAKLGAKVSAIDLSPEIVQIAEERARRHGVEIETFVMPAEKLAFPTSSFDMSFLNDVLHHTDIAATMRELTRVLKPHALVFGNEPYTHSWMQVIRESSLVNRVLYPKMQRYIYGKDIYITEDERKLSERDFELVWAAFQNGGKIDYFSFAAGRMFPLGNTVLSCTDRTILRLMGPLARFLAGRIVFVGEMRQHF